MNDNADDQKPFDASFENNPDSPELQIFQKLNHLKKNQPETLEKIDRVLSDLQKNTLELKRAIRQLNGPHQKLLTVLVARGIHRSVREILIEESVDPEL